MAWYYWSFLILPIYNYEFDLYLNVGIFQGRSKLAVAVFLGISIIYNIPRWLEITWTPAETGDGAYASPTQLRENKDYIDIYVNWMYLVFMYIIPFSCLAILNLLTFLEIRRASQRRARLSSQEQKVSSP